MIPFNKPYLTGKEVHYIYDAVASGKISGNGKYTKMCQQFFEEKYGFKKILLTTSCTDALEMCALLLDIKPGDEVIVPSYTFVSSALAFARQGAKIVFADSRPDHPGIDEEAIENLITGNTRAIVVVHYAGIACNMDKITEIARKHDIFVVEDAAQAIDSYFTVKNGVKTPLGTIGHLAAFSFHETKNIQCGEGGMLAINDQRFIKRAEIIWEKGTNRAAFFRGEIDKYGWVDTGSSFLPSDIIAAFLFAQAENLEPIQDRRKSITERYFRNLGNIQSKGRVHLPYIPYFATNNGHMFYILCKNLYQRTQLMQFLREKQIQTVFHYQSLHRSSYYKEKYHGLPLPNADIYTDCLVRLPLFFELADSQVDYITTSINQFFENHE